jgi:anti-sigma28 factor (negative regulator of flagellin synthesis)
MKVQKFKVRRTITVSHTKDLHGFIERTKPAFEKALLEEIKENITYEVDDKDIAPIITASILVGRK